MLYDWPFALTVTDNSNAPIDLTGYIPGADLVLPDNTTLTASISMPDPTIGFFEVLIPRANTMNLLPSDTGYRLVVYLLDPANLKTPYLVIPLKVSSL